MPTGSHLTNKEDRNGWTKKPRKEREGASCSNPSRPNLESIANFLDALPIEGPPRVVIQKCAQTKAVCIDKKTLHVHTLRLCYKDELNLILLAPHFGVVDEVKIHNFHLYRCTLVKRVHVCIVQTRWNGVERILPYICQGPWVERKGKRERSVKITFDKFLRPSAAAWNEGRPHAQLVCDLPKNETSCITTTPIIPFRHPILCVFTTGYFADSDSKAKIEGNDNESSEAREILMFLGYTSIPLEQS